MATTAGAGAPPPPPGPPGGGGKEPPPSKEGPPPGEDLGDYKKCATCKYYKRKRTFQREKADGSLSKETKSCIPCLDSFNEKNAQRVAESAQAQSVLSQIQFQQSRRAQSTIDPSLSKDASEAPAADTGEPVGPPKKKQKVSLVTSTAAPALPLAAPPPPAAGTAPSSASGPTCANEHCRAALVPGGNRRGPNQTRLCAKCAGRWEHALKAANGIEANVDDSWKTSSRKAPNVPASTSSKGRCKDCGRAHTADLELNEDMRCTPCATRHSLGAAPRPRINTPAFDEDTPYAVLRDIAHREWRNLHPDREDRRVPEPGRNYWEDREESLREATFARGMNIPHHRQKRECLINKFQLDDAWNGVCPRHRPEASELNSAFLQDLQQRAREAGVTLSRQLTAEDYRSFLLGTGILTEDEGLQLHDMSLPDLRKRAITAGLDNRPQTKNSQELKQDLEQTGDLVEASEARAIRQERLQIIRAAVNAAFAGRLRHRTDMGNEITHQTFNGGMVGSARALGRVQIATRNGLTPASTSGSELQCGPRATAMSIQAVRRHYFGRTHNISVYGTPVTADLLRSLLFVNWNDPVTEAAVGIPTPAYQRYIDRRLEQLPEGSEGDEFMNMTQLNNMDEAQLIAMVVLAHEAGMIEERFSVGVVRGSHVNAAGEVIPAFVRIAHEGDENAATIFLHHNSAASEDDYDHWEGFDSYTRDTDIEVALEWGVPSPVTSDLERINLSSSKTKYEGTISKLRREATNAQQKLSRHLLHHRKACKPCRSSDQYLTCSRAPGRPFCDRCKENPEDCIYDEGSAESLATGFVPASEYTDERRQSWRKFQSALEEEEQLSAALSSELAMDIDGLHFLIFGCARHSSHPGPQTMQQTLQAVLQTINAYDNVLNNPQNQNAAEGQRPGGPGTPFQQHLVVIARHGSMPVPTATGNLDSPMLQQFVAMVDHVTRPNNPNPPVEIHFLLSGVAGFSVGIEGWGDRTQGLFHTLLTRDQANGTNLASSTYLVFVLELHVVDPASPSSVNNGQPPHGIRYQNKQVIKVPLEGMIDRHADLRQHAHNLNMNFQTYMQQMGLVHRGAPNHFANNGIQLPPFAGAPAMAEKIDRAIVMMSWEKAWRVAWLDGNTFPTAVMVERNNDYRNSPMHP